MALPLTTGNRSRPAWLARLRAMPAAWWAKVSFAALSAGAFVAFLLLPTYPIYDSEYYLYWGRQILHGQTPSFTIYDAPTEHPLGDRVRHGARDLRQRRAAARGARRDRLVPAHRRRHLPPDADRLHAARRRRRGRAAADALQLRVPRRARLRRRRLRRGDRLGRGARGRAPAARNARLRAAARGRADPPRRVAARRPLLAVVRARGRAGRSDCAGRRSSPPGR